MESERTPLVTGSRTNGISWIFATLSIVDYIGVFPVVALPRPIIDCGWLSIPLSVTLLGAQIYTANLLGKCWLMAETIDPTIVNKTRYPYAAIAELCFGINTSRFVTVILQASIFGAGVPNLLVASQMLHMAGLKTSGFEFDLSFCYWMIILGVVLCPVMWLGSPKDMKVLAMTSCTIVLIVSISTWTCMIQDETQVVDLIQPEPSWEKLAIAYGIIVFQYAIHPTILTIQVDMEHKQKLGHALLAGCAVSGGFFLTTTALAKHKYGGAVTRNLLQMLPNSVLLYVTLVLVTLQICLSMVVGASALFLEVEDKLNIPRDFNWKRCLVRSGILLSIVLIGEFVPRFDLAMGLIGGTLTSPLVFLFPCLFYLKLRSMLQQLQQQLQRTNLLEYYYNKPPAYNPHMNLKSSEGYLTAAEQTYFHRNLTHDMREGKGVPPEGTDEVCFSAVLPSARESRYYGDDFMTSRRSSCETNYLATPLPQGLGWCEKLMHTVIILVGVLATVATTYVSLSEILRVAQMNPPCFF